MQKDLFISYAHADKDYVDSLCIDLDANGISYFMDEKDIKWGASIRDSATDGLRNSAAILLVISPSSNKSAWVPFETGYAQGHGKMVLPLAAYPGVDLPTYLGDAKFLANKKAALSYFSSAVWKSLRETSRSIKPDRSTSIGEAIALSGLIDIENRQNDKNVLPPGSFYQRAEAEIAITGITLFRTVDQDHRVIASALARGTNVRLLAMRPDSPEIPRLEAIHRLALKSQIEDVIDRVKKLEFTSHPRFDIRFSSEAPKFSAVMIDGDISNIHHPNDHKGHIRVQPSTSYQTQHNGIIFQFAKLRPGGALDLFAADVRSQWEANIKSRSDFGL